MNRILDVVASEPVRAAGAALFVATMAMLAAFGVHVDGTQMAAIGAFVAASWGVLEVVRASVTPNKNVAATVQTPPEPYQA